MNYNGIITKMKAQNNEFVSYKLPIGDNMVSMNTLIGKNIKLKFLDIIECTKCGQKIKKSFRQGFCYPCFINAPEASECIFRPELCRAHEGESRDMEWSKKYCLSKQYIYMSFTGNLKIGVTRSTQIPTRWIDQGATKAILLCEAPNRYIAGLIEMYLKKFFSDRTNWRKMLSGKFEEPDFNKNYLDAKQYLDAKFSEYITDSQWVDINYPIESIPEKIKSFSFEKEQTYEGILTGIKGQYLIFKENTVLNIRKHTGYHISLDY